MFFPVWHTIDGVVGSGAVHPDVAAAQAVRFIMMMMVMMMMMMMTRIMMLGSDL